MTSQRDGGEGEPQGGYARAYCRVAGGGGLDGQDGDVPAAEAVFVCPRGEVTDDFAEVAGAGSSVAVVTGRVRMVAGF